MKINHGQLFQMSQCDKDFVNMKINHGQPWLATFILGFMIFILEFIYLGFIIFILGFNIVHRFYNINPWF